MSDTLSTSDVGVTPGGTAFVYAAGSVVQVPKGSTVTYGPWLTVDVGDVLPNAGLLVIEVQAGSAMLQAMNQAFLRTVTLTPLVA